MHRKILVVDDHQVARASVRRLLDSYPIFICGEARDGKEAVEKVIELRPDIVLIDISMPVMDGITAAREIRLISPDTKIVFLTSHDAPAFRDATRMLSDAFVCKLQANSELIPALESLWAITDPRRVSPSKA